MGGGTSLVMALGTDEKTDLYEFYDLSSSIVKVSFKTNSTSLGLVVLEKKLFMWMCMQTQTPQSDTIMPAD